MKVNPPVKLALIPQETAKAKFYFRNFVSVLLAIAMRFFSICSLTEQYPRYRRGNCTFTIHVIGDQPQQFSHIIKFNTYPDPLSKEKHSYSVHIIKCYQ